MSTVIIHLLRVLHLVGKSASPEDAVKDNTIHCTVSGGAGYLN